MVLHLHDPVDEQGETHRAEHALPMVAVSTGVTDSPRLADFRTQKVLDVLLGAIEDIVNDLAASHSLPAECADRQGFRALHGEPRPARHDMASRSGARLFNRERL